MCKKHAVIDVELILQDNLIITVHNDALMFWMKTLNFKVTNKLKKYKIELLEVQVPQYCT